MPPSGGVQARLFFILKPQVGPLQSSLAPGAAAAPLLEQLQRVSCQRSICILHACCLLQRCQAAGSGCLHSRAGGALLSPLPAGAPSAPA